LVQLLGRSVRAGRKANPELGAARGYEASRARAVGSLSRPPPTTRSTGHSPLEELQAAEEPRQCHQGGVRSPRLAGQVLSDGLVL